MSGRERARSLRARLAALAVAAVLLAGATVTAVVFWRQAEWRAAIEEGNSVIAEAAAPGRQSEALAHAVRAIENRGPKKGRYLPR